MMSFFFCARSLSASPLFWYDNDFACTWNWNGKIYERFQSFMNAGQARQQKSNTKWCMQNRLNINIGEIYNERNKNKKSMKWIERGWRQKEILIGLIGSLSVCVCTCTIVEILCKTARFSMTVMYTFTNYKLHLLFIFISHCFFFVWT